MAKVDCLTYCAMPYNGRGWTETCVNTLENLPSAGVTPILVLPRATKALPRTVRAVESLPFPLSKLPWQFVGAAGVAKLNDLFRLQISKADPTTTVAYFWPGTPVGLVNEAKQAGILTIRQMINTFQGSAKKILDRAYSELSLPGECSITHRAVEDEIEELNLYDYVFAPNPEVERSLQEASVPTERIVPTSFGWSPSRFNSNAVVRETQRPLRFLFVGIACVRKGIPDLLEAWKNAGIKGELVIVGNVEAAIQDRVANAVREGSVRHVPFTDRIETFYYNSDVFVLPTLEEGGPQVTLEAGGCGLPVITTPMGAARLVKNDVNGIIVESRNIDQLTYAIQRISRDTELRVTFSKKIKHDSCRFTYDKISNIHGAIISKLLTSRNSKILKKYSFLV